MNKSAVLFALSSVLVGGFGAVAVAADDDPGFGPERPMFGTMYGPGGRNLRPWIVQPYGLSDRELKPLYYKPTMRYYGNGYTVNYRYVPVYRANAFSSDFQGESANFPTEAFRLSPEEVAKWGANPPRLTVKDDSSVPRSAVTSIVHKKSTGKASTRGAKGKTAEPDENGTPAVLPSNPGGAPAPTPTATPVTPAAPAAPAKP